MGEKSAQNFLDGIEWGEQAAGFVAAVVWAGDSACGRGGRAKALGKCFATLDDLFATSLVQLTEIEDVGEVIAQSLTQWRMGTQRRIAS